MREILDNNNLEKGDDSLTAVGIFAECSRIFRLSLREQEQCCSKIRAIILNFEGHRVHYVFLCFLVMMQIKLTEDYYQYGKGQMSLDALMDRIRVHAGDKLETFSVYNSAKVYLKYTKDKAQLMRRLEELQSQEALSPDEANVSKLLFSIYESFEFCSKHFELAELAASLD